MLNPRCSFNLFQTVSASDLALEERVYRAVLSSNYFVIDIINFRQQIVTFMTLRRHHLYKFFQLMCEQRDYPVETRQQAY